MFHAICIRTERIILFCHRVHRRPAGGQGVVVPCAVIEVRKARKLLGLLAVETVRDLRKGMAYESWYTITIFCPEKKSSADDHLESHPHCPKL